MGNIKFHQMYHPITSRPFLSTESYTEHAPSNLLRPYISCYWSEGESADSPGRKEILVIPDTCMDIIIRTDHDRQSVSGYLSTIQDQPFSVISGENNGRISTFAIRFYFWSAHLFLNVDFKDVYNQDLELIHLGHDWNLLMEQLFYMDSLEEKIRWTEQFLLRRLDSLNPNTALFNSFQQMIGRSGRMSVKEICEYCGFSQRQMERQFLKAVGLPMKRVSNLVRYQNVWKNMVLSESFDVQDAVYRYGYTDQSHLLKEFKRFHGTTPEEARNIAERNR